MGKRREGDLYFTCGEKGLCSLVPLKLVKTGKFVFKTFAYLLLAFSVKTNPS